MAGLRRHQTVGGDHHPWDPITQKVTHTHWQPLWWSTNYDTCNQAWTVKYVKITWRPASDPLILRTSIIICGSMPFNLYMKVEIVMGRLLSILRFSWKNNPPSLQYKFRLIPILQNASRFTHNVDPHWLADARCVQTRTYPVNRKSVKKTTDSFFGVYG